MQAPLAPTASAGPGRYRMHGYGEQVLTITHRAATALPASGPGIFQKMNEIAPATAVKLP